MLWQDLRRRGADRLTRSQQIGLRYFEDLQLKIPRIEVAGVERVVQLVCEMILPGATCQAVGSYRRCVLALCAMHATCLWLFPM